MEKQVKKKRGVKDFSFFFLPEYAENRTLTVPTYGSDAVLLPCALSDEVARVHTLLDLWCSLSQTLIQVGCGADVDAIHCTQQRVFALL